MNKFHQISTDKFRPLSYENTYLFNHYDKVLNFIKARIGHKYGHILAKPVQRDYEIEWFSPFNNLHDISEKKTKAALLQYFEFHDLLNKQVEQLASSNDPDAKNWASLLTKVFDKENNVIFSNGKEISVIWGWEFENNTIHRPTFGDFTEDNGNHEKQDEEKLEAVPDSLAPQEPENQGAALEQKTEIDPVLPEEEVDALEQETEFSPLVPEEDAEKEEEFFLFEDDMSALEPEPEKIPSKSFLEFLKEFAARYWWLLVLLLVLCVIIFFVKSLLYT